MYSHGNILFSENGDMPIDILRLKKDENSQDRQKVPNFPNQRSQEISALRGSKIAMIFQEPMTSLNPVIKCGKQVQEVIKLHKNVTKKVAKRQTINWLSKVELPNPELLFNKYPHQLSGGQKQRVMIAMAMCCQPSLLICDEPTTALDVTVQKTILRLIKQLQQEQNMGVLFITHDLGVVSEIADKVAIMYKGEILEQNTTRNIFMFPQHPYTKALIACRPSFHPKGTRLPIVDDFLLSKADSATNSTSFYQDKNLQKEVLMNVENISVRFPASRNLLGSVTNYFTAVDDVCFEINKGETLGLVGESGCGKTTLGRTVIKLVEPYKGDIWFKGNSITRLKADHLKDFRKEVQLIFQDPFSSLNPRLTINDALEEPLKLFSHQTSQQRKKMIAALLDQVQLPSQYARRYPHEFSGGQRQRIVIARALAMNPTFLVCDESVSALDVSVQAQVLNLLNDLKKELGLTLLFISHDLSVVRYMSDRLMVMQNGRIVEAGESEEVYTNPKQEYTRQLLSAIPKMIIK
jgi:peptide/nickel transport system ATP-binding protein